MIAYILLLITFLSLNPEVYGLGVTRPWALVMDSRLRLESRPNSNINFKYRLQYKYSSLRSKERLQKSLYP